jgi:hypothetical protein
MVSLLDPEHNQVIGSARTWAWEIFRDFRQGDAEVGFESLLDCLVGRGVIFAEFKIEGRAAPIAT